MVKRTKNNEIDTLDDNFGDNSFDDLDVRPRERDRNTSISSDFYDDDLGDHPIENDNSRWEMDSDDVFNVVERSLRGQAMNKDGSKWIKVAPPLCNNFGIAHIMRWLRAIVNKNFILSNFKKEEINNMMKRIMKGFIGLLQSSYKEFGITSKWQLNEIVSIFEDNVFATLKRAEGGIERKIRRDKYRLTENMNNGGSGGGLNPFAMFSSNKNNEQRRNEYNEVNI